ATDTRRSLLTGHESHLLPAETGRYLSGHVHWKGLRRSSYQERKGRTSHSGLQTATRSVFLRTANYGEWIPMAVHLSPSVVPPTPAAELGQPAMRSFWVPMGSRYSGFLRQEEPPWRFLRRAGMRRIVRIAGHSSCLEANTSCICIRQLALAMTKMKSDSLQSMEKPISSYRKDVITFLNTRWDGWWLG